MLKTASKIILILTSITFFYACNKRNNINFAKNPVIAHRGAWKTNNLPKNSIASLKQAITLGCTGSEFDVRMTADSVLIVAHDADYKGLDIENSNFEELSKHKLSNGETLPTFRQYLQAGMTNNTSTGLVCEIKPSKFKKRNHFITEQILATVKELKAAPYILSYISFSYDILKQIKTIDHSAKTQYLNGSKPPETLKKDGISGLDYLIDKLKDKPEWIESAKTNNLILNAWTINKPDNIDWILTNNFDYITTDRPELVFERIKKVHN